MNRLRSALILSATAAVACGAHDGTKLRPPPTPTLTVQPVVPTEGTPSCLSVVGWNDMHGQILPETVPVDLGRVPAGGVIAVADRVAEIRALGDAVVVLDAGDMFTGPFVSSAAEGEPIVEAYTLIGVDAAVIGNHEFDFGPVGFSRVRAEPSFGDDRGRDGPRGALLARMAQASFPFLSANIRRKGGAPTGWHNHLPSTVIDRAGFRVGVVGYTTQDTPTTTLKPNVDDLDFSSDAARHVDAEIARLRGQGASPVVLLAHASMEGELPQSLEDPLSKDADGEIPRLLAKLQNLPDLILAGHRHAWLLGRVRGVPIVSSDHHGVGVSRSRFCRSSPRAEIKLASIDRSVTLASGSPSTPLGQKVMAAMTPWLSRTRAESEALVTHLSDECTRHGQRGSALAEQVAHATLLAADKALPPPKGAALVGITNIGGLRANLPKGAVHFADLFAMYPFESTVSVCATTKSGLTRVLKNALARDSSRDRFPFGLSGARVTLRKRASGGFEVDHVDVPPVKDKRGREREADLIWLAMPDFLLWGGNGYLDGVTCTIREASQVRVRDAFRERLESTKSCSGPAKNTRFK